MTETIAIVPHYQNAAKFIKKARPHTPICVGGFYIAANYQSVAEDTPEFDFLIAGEPEMTFTELCQELSKPKPDLASVKGLVHRQNGSIKINAYRSLMKNLDDLPMPAYDLFPMDKYQGWSTLKHYQEIFTSRGCPFGCGFCIDWLPWIRGKQGLAAVPDQVSRAGGGRAGAPGKKVRGTVRPYL